MEAPVVVQQFGEALADYTRSIRRLAVLCFIAGFGFGVGAGLLLAGGV
jgi:hypothetical protein